MAEPEPELLSEDARKRIESTLEDFLDKETLSTLVREVLAITKQARGWCPNCKKAVQVQIPDAKAVVSSMGDLLTQAKGRPPPDEIKSSTGAFCAGAVETGRRSASALVR